jgi:5-deoxy-glucuronate isomerase
MKDLYYTQLQLKEKVNSLKIRPGLFKYIQGFEILLLKNGEQFVLETGGCEAGLVVLKGSCSIASGGKTFQDLGGRVDIFKQRPQAAYLPRESEVTIKSRGVELAVCFAKCKERKEFAVINPDQVKVMQVGRDNWQRQVTLIISPETYSANLLIGETINPPGNWSGTPAHKHEVEDLPQESLHEELYYFRCNRPQGFGLQRFYSPQRQINESIYLKENTITLMPWGYHQIVAGPGYTLYYLFFLAGPGKKLVGLSDPEHSWITKT